MNIAGNGWVLAQLHKVQHYLKEKLYSEEHLAAIKASFAIWIRSAIEKLRTLHTSFNPVSGDFDKDQLFNLMK